MEARENGSGHRHRTRMEGGWKRERYQAPPCLCSAQSLLTTQHRRKGLEEDGSARRKIEEQTHKLRESMGSKRERTRGSGSAPLELRSGVETEMPRKFVEEVGRRKTE